MQKQEVEEIGGESMKTVKKIKQVLEYIFWAIGVYFGICILCVG